MGNAHPTTFENTLRDSALTPRDGSRYNGGLRGPHGVGMGGDPPSGSPVAYERKPFFSTGSPQRAASPLRLKTLRFYAKLYLTHRRLLAVASGVQNISKRSTNFEPAVESSIFLAF